MVRSVPRVSSRSVVLLVCPLLTWCSGSFVVKPMGSVTEGIRFEFWRRADDAAPRAFTIEDLEVQRLGADGSWKRCWRVAGSARLSEIKFGETPGGMQPTGDITWLQFGGRYRALVHASDATAWNAAVEFEIGPDGKPQVPGSS
jgi:hypothetical protein